MSVKLTIGKVMTDKLVFLGGTCGNNLWRTGFIAALVARGVSPDVFFDPVVKVWNEEARIVEEDAKKNASYLVFYIADPKDQNLPISIFSLVEATMALYDQPDRTIVVFDAEGMSGHALKVMNASLKALKKRFPDAPLFSSIEEAKKWLATVLKG